MIASDVLTYPANIVAKRSSSSAAKT